MEEVKDSFFLDDQEYEQLLIRARERYAKSKQLYEEAVTIKVTQPIEAVKLLYKSYELNYSSEAKEELFNSNVPLSTSPEILDEKGSGEELFYRGLQALSGIGRDRNEEVALRYLHLAAEKKYAPAQTRIGILYRDGKCGFAQDHTKAVECWKSAAEKKEVIAQSCLGSAYFNGNGVIQDFILARKWFYRAARQEDPWGQTNLGFIFFNADAVQQNYPLAYKWFRLAAEQGYPQAQASLGILYFKGLGVPQNYAEALKWYQLAAEKNEPRALCGLGIMYAEGLGVIQNYGEAMKWYRLSAEQKLRTAYYNIGMLFYLGYGVARDLTEALKWFHLAAEQEHPKAQYSLGTLYFDPPYNNQKESMKWFRRAAKQGVTYPQGKLIGIRSLLFSYKPTTDDFHAHYDFAMMNHDSPALQQLCARDPNLFCEALQNDTLLTTEECYEWVRYLFEHHFLQMDLHLQLYLAEKIYFHGPITNETAINLIKTFHFFYPEDKERYADAMRLLWNLAQLIDPKGYLVQYYLYKYLEKKPEDKYLYETHVEIDWKGLALYYCKAELEFPVEEFTSWLETHIRKLEASERPLSTSHLNLLNEFYFKLAKIEYQKMLKLKHSQETSLFSQMTSLWWSSPPPIDITPIVILLKKIPLEHTRFEEAQLLLKECRVKFKESFQEIVGSEAAVVKLGLRKQE